MNAQQYGKWSGAWMRAIPDVHFDTRLLVSEDDETITNYPMAGTHSATLQMPGAPGIPATGRKVKMQGSNCAVIKDGKITHLQILFDTQGIMQQLGAMPGMAAGQE